MRTPAEAAALILASDGAYDGLITLTAAAAPTFADIASIAAEISGTTVDLVVMEQEEWVAAQVATGQQEFMLRFLLGTYQAAGQGFFAGVDPLLGTLLHRAPLTARDVLAQPAAH